MVSLCLKLKAVAAFLDVEKIKQMKGRQAHYTRSLKPCCHGDQPTRSPDISCVPTQETSRTVIGRRSTCRTALPCSRFLVPCSTILSPRSKAHQREICAGYCCCSPAPYVRPRELLEQSQLFAGRHISCRAKRSASFDKTSTLSIGKTCGERTKKRATSKCKGRFVSKPNFEFRLKRTHAMRAPEPVSWQPTGIEWL